VAPTPRALLLGGDFFLGAVIAASITKLALHLRALRALPPAQLNRTIAQTMALIAAMMRLGEAGGVSGGQPLDADSRERMATCLRALAEADEGLERVWLDGCRAAFANLIHDKQQREAAEAKQEV
jgi:coatomer subunit beta